MNSQLLILLMIAMSLGLPGCTSLPSKDELAVLQRYQSIDSYGAVSIKADISNKHSMTLAQLVLWSKKYAGERGATLINSGELTEKDSQIIISTSNKKGFVAQLYRGGQQLDQLEFSRTDEENAQLIIDEMLLLWHPPATYIEQRSPVPRFALEPIFYKVSKEDFIAMMTSNVEHINMGHQKWYQLTSLTPIFSWEAFPRQWDIPAGMSANDFKEVRYQFRLGLAPSLNTDYLAKQNAYEKTLELKEPKYIVQQKLPFCRQLMWTVRALFNLNGVPRQTEWSGAYSLYPSLPERPWIIRRGISRFLAARIKQSAYYFALRTPPNPFADGCVYD